MFKFASMVVVAFTCVSGSIFAQEMGEEVVVNSEVSVSNDDDGFSRGDAAPEYSQDCKECGCSEKPKK